MKVQLRRKKATKMPNFLCAKSLGFFKASFTQERLNICCVSGSPAGSEQLAGKQQREADASPAASSSCVSPGHVWAGCEQGRAAPLSASFPPLQRSSPGAVSLSQALNSGQPRCCRSCPAGARLFCLAGLTGHPGAAHLLLLLQTFPVLRAPPVPQRMQPMPGAGEKRFPDVSASRGFDPRQLCWVIGTKESCFSCLH